jgi:hypothetical protein
LPSCQVIGSSTANPAQTRERDDCGCLTLGPALTLGRCHLIEAEMRAVLVVVGDVFAEQVRVERLASSAIASDQRR